MGMHNKSHIYDEQLPRLIRDGATMSEAARALGVSYDAVRAAKRRRDLAFPHEQRLQEGDIAAMLQGLSDRESVEFLLEVIESLRNALRPVDTAIAERFGLSFLENRMLGVLMAADGNVVRKESIYDALYFDRSPDDLPDFKSFEPILSNLRRKMDPRFGVIELQRGFGWRFVKRGLV